MWILNNCGPDHTNLVTFYITKPAINNSDYTCQFYLRFSHSVRGNHIATVFVFMHKLSKQGEKGSVSPNDLCTITNMNQISYPWSSYVNLPSNVCIRANTDFVCVCVWSVWFYRTIKYNGSLQLHTGLSQWLKTNICNSNTLYNIWMKELAVFDGAYSCHYSAQCLFV